jgi:hypothetical protein
MTAPRLSELARKEEGERHEQEIIDFGSQRFVGR